MTTNVSNQGIAHLAFKAGGQPFCKTRRAHIVIAYSDRASWPRICARCDAKAAKRAHPLDETRDAALDIIKKIAARAVNIYAQHEIRIDEVTVVMDLTACHFHGGQKLRLDDLLAADDFNFIHDISGINRHLDRETYKLANGFTPRFAARAAA